MDGRIFMAAVVAAAVSAFGTAVALTSTKHPSTTHRECSKVGGKKCYTRCIPRNGSGTDCFKDCRDLTEA